MSTATEISRLQSARNIIRNKLISFGLAESTDLLDDLADAIDNISYQGAVTATVQEGDSYTIPAGYHNGSGTVSGVAGGGNYNLQTKTVTPTKSQQSISPDNGYYGLSAVTVNAIPEAYQDVSSVTATAADVLANKVIVTPDGTVTAGTMSNNGAISKVLDATTSNQTYTVPAGYHNGSGVVSISLEQKTATPTESTQTITPTSGKVLSQVTVDPIPGDYVDVSDATASATNLLAGETAYSYDSTEDEPVKLTGTMTNNGAVTGTLDASTTSYTIPEGYHNGSGMVSITLEQKTATPTESTQTITPTSGKVLSQVTVNPIPGDYVDVSDATASAANLLSGETAYSYDSTQGEPVKLTGSMTVVGAVSASLDTSVTSYTVPQGYHNGSGTVSITLEEKSATPTTSSQNITPTSGQVLSKVTVAAIPGKFADTTGDDAIAGDILYGKKAHSISSGSAVALTGTMVNNGAITGSIDGLTTMSYTVPAGYHNGSGTVSLTSDIEDALAAI